MVADTLNLGGRSRRILVSSKSARTTQRDSVSIFFFLQYVFVYAVHACVCSTVFVWESEDKFGSLTSHYFKMILLLVFIL